MSTGGGEEHGSRMLLSSHSYNPVELQNERCREERRGRREKEKKNQREDVTSYQKENPVNQKS